MAYHGKRYKAVKGKAPAESLELADAIRFLQENRVGRFDETMEIGIRLGVDPTKTEQTVRGTVSLPHGTGKKVRVLVFAQGPAADAARAAGADAVGMDDMIQKVQGGWTDFDVAIATTEAMKEVRKLGKVLGPRGLMPNPKTGTVTDDTAAAVKLSKAGRVEFRMDRHGNVNVPFGKISFPVEQLKENAETILAALSAERPAAAKGVFLKRCTVTSTMGVGVRIIVKEA
ncbi:MAG: 50S ribosomal protein L1 [Lentisphaerae bacterium RIFOXYC12_FULL_60_16]|nr:MAG: 50S ribosomal protein L1 [Lentisphaerae bacterium RIFOXYC12_FULL_60_16]OGV71156.1 MAG: 50S ribosomal protein L1 [Lentisphaerae bacterium RIFOXYA12_FULL_60_10]OGV77332.1 MAG: 50S ribosomal protein L1 [Lentisphaerae bacterium RIFOXYB12_FULL_60_10]